MGLGQSSPRGFDVALIFHGLERCQVFKRDK
jgi:hypothetical protein